MGESLVSDGMDAGETKYFLSRFTEGETVWVKGTKDTIWDLGKVIAAFAKSGDDTVAVATNNGRNVVTRKVFGGEEIPVHDGKVGYSDMTAMRFVNEPQILENLRQRSYHDMPYTFLGPVLVAVNPMMRLASMDKYKPGQKNIIGHSHPYAVAELAYQQMLFAIRRKETNIESPLNQTVIVSGESGAGKTVSSKLVLEHLVTRSGGGDLAQAMLGSNPISESFGNAKTLRNPNSSRFGKMFRVLYDEDGSGIVGASVGTYLLERSRVTNHELGERNYHIFYEILRGADDKILDVLHLDKTRKYKVLVPHTKNDSLKNVEFLDVDKENYEATIAALGHVGFEEHRLTDLLGAVASILHLGDVDFDALVVGGNDASRVSDATRDSFDKAAELLGVSADEFEKVFTELERKVGAQVIKSPVSAVHAKQLLEGLSKALYARIFEFMIMTVNQYINKAGRQDLPTIGVLDIFGFETFAKNDIEQLLINYTNEALQLTFNKQVLEAEAALYEREKLAISEQDKSALDPSQVIDQSNKLCIDLLQGVTLEAPTKKKKKSFIPGILDVIHEQGRVPNPTEKKMLEKLHKTFAGKDLYPNYMVIKKKARTEFIVKHYAGKVTYTTGSFLLKNVDSLPKSATEIFLSSTKETSKAIWDAGANLVSGKKASIVSTFKKQITQLNLDLNSTQCSFIRCMKPNVEMHRNKGWFNRRYITIQLRNLSVPKTADVLKAGLPTRIAYSELVERYKETFGARVRLPDLESERGVKSFIAALFYAFETPRSCYKLGLTKVFFKSGDLDKLEEILSAADSWTEGNLDATAEAERERVVGRYRSYYLARQWRVIFAAMFAGRMFTKQLLAQRRQRELERTSAILLQRQLRMFVARKKYRAMLYAKKLEEERIAREKAEAERIERERLAEIARQKELEKQKQVREFLQQRREQQRKQKEKFAKMLVDFKQANEAAADFREKENELKRQERERREAEELAKKEETERQKRELEKLQKEREEQERLAQEAAEEEKRAKQAYEEKLRKEQAEAEAQKAKNVVESKEYVDYMEKKLERDQEKLEEKIIMEQVVEELIDRELRQHNQRNLVEEDDDEIMDDDNPWFFYEDLDLDDIDNISHDSQDEVRINEALSFLDNLVDDDDDSDDDEDSDSDLESRENEMGFELAARADNTVTKFKDYNGPFIVNVHLNKLEVNTAKKKRFNGLKPSMNTWKQCFAFIYPAHQRVLLHYNTNTTLKVEFNSRGNTFPAMLRRSEVFQKKNHVVYVSGVRISDKDDKDADVSRDLIISFQDKSKREQFAGLLLNFVPSEDDLAAGAGAAAKTKENKRGPSVAARAPRFTARQDRRDMIRNQNYTRFALLNQAVKAGKLSKERVQGILLQPEDEEDEDFDDVGQLVACVSCGRAVEPSHVMCPHCGATQG